MKTASDVFSVFHLSKKLIDKISKEVRNIAEEEGTKGEEKNLSPGTYQLLVDISDRIVQLPLEEPDNISLTFSVYEYFPNIHLFQHAIFRAAIRENNDREDRLRKELIWKLLVKCLSGEDYTAYPIRRMLREFYFEDEETLEETWQGLLNERPNSKAICYILEAAAKVPWALKEPVYYSLLNNKANHTAIFDSMFNSAFEEEGDLDRKKAFNLLKRLSISPRPAGYSKLLKKIKPIPLPKTAVFGQSISVG